MGRGKGRLVPTLMILLAPALAAANGLEDMFGVGPRLKAAGGAGTAMASGYEAVYYNPGALVRCRGSSGGVGYNTIAYDLEVRTEQGVIVPDDMQRRDVFSVGMCHALPLDLHLGMHFAVNRQSALLIDQGSINATPDFVMYGKRLDTLSVQLGGAYHLLDRVGIGVAVSILANSQLNVSNDIPLFDDGEVQNSYSWQLGPRIAPYAGLLVSVLDNWDVGLSYRGSIGHRLRTRAPTTVRMVGLTMQLDLLLESTSWYSPQQAALGTVVQPIEGLTLSADLTWYDWSDYPGPFIWGQPDPDSALARTLVFPEREEPGFSDIFVPRLGAEYLWRERVALRGGYGLRPSPAPTPAGRANLLDGTTHRFSVGIGGRYTAEKPVPWHLELDVFASLFWMPAHEVVKAEGAAAPARYSFGGRVLDAGLALTLGY